MQQAIHYIQGKGLEKTIITWNDDANASNSTNKTASVAIEADHFIAPNISFKNSAPKPQRGAKGGQAIALQVVGDKIAFYGCGMYGYQDTERSPGSPLLPRVPH